MKNTINLVIPTMWKEQKLVEYLQDYCSSEYINKIIIIDNFYQARPKVETLNNSKIDLVSYGRNIYVNPAWNEGYYRSNSDIVCLLNDDIFVEDSVFQYVSKLNFSEIDLIGVHLRGSVDNFHIVNHSDQEEKLLKLNLDKTSPIGGQAYAFGVCIFVKRTSYKVIPSLYQIWYGDDYLVQRSKHVYALKTNKIHGEISKTIVAETTNKNSEIQKRIDLDSLNAYKYNHFLNGKMWKFPEAAYLKNLSN
jgi:hypothetical protein